MNGRVTGGSARGAVEEAQGEREHKDVRERETSARTHARTYARTHARMQARTHSDTHGHGRREAHEARQRCVTRAQNDLASRWRVRQATMHVLRRGNEGRGEGGGREVRAR